jgi:hypothetical protein
MIAITTRYIGPSNTRGSRITAFAWSPEGRRQSVSVNYRHDCHGSDNYRDAAVAWVKRFAPACAVSASAGDTGNGETVFLACRAGGEPMPFVPVT